LSQPPSSWVVGTLEDAAEQIVALREAGVHRLMCQHLLHNDLDAVALIGRELPALL
jgi:alkanesulfonate monooxygenase SsuD/methylene tetrahydromethanopterin reductase-like flavin-dependent oxidoreductase (luciferase family)